MTHPVPKVYIGGRLMDDFAASNKPVLAGMNYSFGMDSDLDFPEPATATIEILIVERESLDFLELGTEIAIYRPADAASIAYTYFVGRIQRMAGVPDSSVDGAIRITIEAADLLTDLQTMDVENVNTTAVDATTRASSLQYWTPPGWVLQAYALRWPTLTHAGMIYDSAAYLELLDGFARGQIMRRLTSCTFDPDTGIRRAITLMQDSTRDVRPDQLTKFSGSQRWGITPGLPYGDGTVQMNLDAGNVHRDAGWVKEPEDLITEVALDMIRPPVWDADAGAYEESETITLSSANYVDTTATVAKAGRRKTSLATDLAHGTVTSTHLRPIFEHWLADGSEWRTSNLSIVDSDLLSATELRWLLSVERLLTNFLVVRGAMDNRPDAGNYMIRGYVIGGDATWTGDKWDINVRLGRVPGVAAAGDWWTCERIAADPEWANATCASVGDALSFKDFRRIGAP